MNFAISLFLLIFATYQIRYIVEKNRQKATLDMVSIKSNFGI